MFCEQKTPEQMIKDSEIATKNALHDLKSKLQNPNQLTDSLDVEISNDSIDSISYDDNLDLNKLQFDESSDDDSIQEEIVLRKSGTKQKHHKKENSMIFIFSKYESVQKKNRAYKTKIIKLENKLSKLEERDHFKNLDFNNTKLQVSELQDKVKQLQSKLKKSKNDLLYVVMLFIFIYSLTLFVFFQFKSYMFDFWD